MSLSCWKVIGSPSLNQSPTTLKAFDGRRFKPSGILNMLQVELASKTVSVEFEVIDRPLDYNLLLGHTWIYAMAAVVSTYIRMIAFPHQGVTSWPSTSLPFLPIILRLMEASLLWVNPHHLANMLE